MKKISNYSIRTTIGLIVTAVLILNLGQGITKGIQTIEKSEKDLSLSSLIPHDFITIISDSGFLAYLGSGTVEDPYVIEGFNITTTHYTGIYISDTTKYFIVRNCYIDAKDYGIEIRNIADGTATVINNTCSNTNYRGITLWGSISSTVANNTCNNNNNHGIYLFHSDSSTVTNNTCSNNNEYGIFLDYSSSSTVANNTCSNNKFGIYLRYSGSSMVADNTCNNSEFGIFLRYSSSSNVVNNTCSYNSWDGIFLEDSGSSTVANSTCNNNNYGIKFRSSGSLTIVDNTFTNCGLEISVGSIDTYLSYTIENNWVNGKKLGFYINLDSTIIAEPIYGQLILVNCTNVTIRDQILNNAGTGLSLHFCRYSTINNNTCNNNNYRGIFLDADDCVVTYNLLQENMNYGIFLSSGSDNNLIHHNTFVDNNLGETSQAYDSGETNTWYDIEIKEGNYWSDWSGTGFYSIDGSADSVDQYPLDEPVGSTTTEHTSVESTTDENQLNFTFTLLIVVVPLIFTRIISKKTKK